MKFMNVASAGGDIRMAKIARGADYFGVTIPEERAFALMDQYIEMGGNVIDTARVYGKARSDDAEHSNSEPIVGRWLRARGNRDRVVLVTKGCHHKLGDLSVRRLSRDCIDHDLAVSLRELGTDYTDVYFMHRDDPSKPVEEIIDALHTHVAAGKIRALGASNWTCARIAQANAYAKAAGKTPFTISQVQWGVAYVTNAAWDDPSLICMDEAEYAGYLANKIPVMAFSPQAGGYFSKMLSGGQLNPKFIARYDNVLNRRRLEAVRALCEKTGKSPAAICLAYVTSNPVEGCAVVGCSTLAQQADSLSGMDLALSAQDCALLVK